MFTGYRELSSDEKEFIEGIKALAQTTSDAIDELKQKGSPDPYWLGIASSNLQVGFMALTRSIAKPESF